ncbi:hypothetical protein DFJ74DRAFT_141126 [Hyaloraphidium curvatum]|nr:hypothetical protein DFJ74DRAFT_141126 [Hyaloraphidium curvatum]
MVTEHDLDVADAADDDDQDDFAGSDSELADADDPDMDLSDDLFEDAFVEERACDLCGSTAFRNDFQAFNSCSGSPEQHRYCGGCLVKHVQTVAAERRPQIRCPGCAAERPNDPKHGLLTNEELLPFLVRAPGQDSPASEASDQGSERDAYENLVEAQRASSGLVRCPTCPNSWTISLPDTGRACHRCGSWCVLCNARPFHLGLVCAQHAHQNAARELLEAELRLGGTLGAAMGPGVQGQESDVPGLLRYIGGGSLPQHRLNALRTILADHVGVNIGLMRTLLAAFAAPGEETEDSAQLALRSFDRVVSTSLGFLDAYEHLSEESASEIEDATTDQATPNDVLGPELDAFARLREQVEAEIDRIRKGKGSKTAREAVGRVLRGLAYLLTWRWWDVISGSSLLAPQRAADANGDSRDVSPAAATAQLDQRPVNPLLVAFPHFQDLSAYNRLVRVHSAPAARTRAIRETAQALQALQNSVPGDRDIARDFQRVRDMLAQLSRGERAETEDELQRWQNEEERRRGEEEVRRREEDRIRRMREEIGRDELFRTIREARREREELARRIERLQQEEPFQDSRRPVLVEHQMELANLWQEMEPTDRRLEDLNVEMARLEMQLLDVQQRLARDGIRRQRMLDRIAERRLPQAGPIEPVAFNPAEPDAAFNAIADREGWKKCPFCGIMVEKVDGCNHITCTRCRNHFCYRCSGPYPNCRCRRGSGEGYE